MLIESGVDISCLVIPKYCAPTNIYLCKTEFVRYLFCIGLSPAKYIKGFEELMRRTHAKK